MTIGEPPSPTVDSGQAHAAVLERATALFDGAQAEAEAVELQGANVLPATYRIFRVTVYNALPASVVYMVVSGDGQAWLMPDEFNDMIPSAAVQAGTATEAITLFQTYLQLKGPGKNLLLEKAGDIPFQEGIWTDPAELAGEIEPPRVEAVGDGYRLTAYSWSESGGTVTQWEVTIGRGGQVTVAEFTRLTDRIGDGFIRQ